DRVAVGLRSRDHLDSDVAAVAAAVLDYELLPGDLRQLRAEQARQRVGRTARRIGIDVADWLDRPRALSARFAADDPWRGESRGNLAERTSPVSLPDVFHNPAPPLGPPEIIVPKQ